MAAGRKPNFPLITTKEGGGDYPPGFPASTDVVSRKQTGQDVRNDFEEANPPGTLLESKLEQISTQERILEQTIADFSGLILSSETSDPSLGIVEQIDRSIVRSLGGVSSTVVTAAGSGYTTASATSPTPDGGRPALYKVNLVAGAVSSLDIIDPGSGHGVAPVITITGDGTGATATATIPSAPVSNASGLYLGLQNINKWDSVSEAKGWSNPPPNQNSFNYDITYDEANGAYPTFIRRYLVARAQYEFNPRLANGTSYTGVFGVKITNFGSTFLTPPTVAITDTGGGSGATARAIINADGSLARIVLLTEGQDYTDAAIVTVSGGGGSGVTAVPVLQPASCVLVREDTQDTHAAWSAVFLYVIRYYKTLPGPLRQDNPLDVDGAVVTETKQAKVFGDITPAESRDVGANTSTRLTLENVKDFSYFADEVIKTRTIPGNILHPSGFDFQTNSQLAEIRQLVWFDADQPPFDNTLETWKREPFQGSKYICWDSIKNWPAALSTDLTSDVEKDTDGDLIYSIRVKSKPMDITFVENITGSGPFQWNSVTKENVMGHLRDRGIRPVSTPNGTDLYTEQVTRSRVVPSTKPILRTYKASSGEFITELKTLMDFSEIEQETEDIVSNVWYKLYLEPHARSLQVVGWQVSEAVSLPYTLSPSSRIGSYGEQITITRTIVAAPGTKNQTVDGVIWNRRNVEPHPRSDGTVVIQIVESVDLSAAIPLVATRIEAIGGIMTLARVYLDNATPAVTSEGLTGTVWVRKYKDVYNGTAQKIVWQVTETVDLSTLLPRLSSRFGSIGEPIAISKTLIDKNNIVNQQLVTSGVLYNYVSTPHEGSDGTVAWQLTETTPLPSKVVTDFITHIPTGLSVLVAKRKVDANSLYTTGEFIPPAINVSAISLGATVTVTVASAYDFPIGSWVTFVGTTSTPPIDGKLQILSTPSPITLTVTPVATVTIIGGAFGTMQGPRIVRDLKTLPGATAVKVRIDTMLAVPDITAYNESIPCWKNYRFPAYANGFNFYIDAAKTQTGGAKVIAMSASFSGVVGIPKQEGYSGPCRAIRKRYLFDGPPPASFAGGIVVTISHASPGVITWASHGFSIGDTVQFSSTGTLPAPLATVTTYYVVSITTNTFTISSTPGGSAINTTTTGSGTHTGYRFSPTFILLSSGTIAIEGGTISNSSNIGGTSSTVAFSNNWKIQNVGPFLTGAAPALVTVPTIGTGAPIALVSVNIGSPYSGTTPGITTATAHGFTSTAGDNYAYIKNSGTTPSIDGWQVVTGIPSATVFQIAPGFTLTSGSSGVGTLYPTGQATAIMDLPQSIPAKFNQGDIITLVDQPQRLGVAGLWECYVWFVTCPNTSGSAPT